MRRASPPAARRAHRRHSGRSSPPPRRRRPSARELAAAARRRRGAPLSGSTVRMPPGPRRPRRTVSPSGRGTAPARTPPRRDRRLPRSGAAATVAVECGAADATVGEDQAAGPSHGSPSSASKRCSSRTSGSRRGSFCQAGGTSRVTASARSRRGRGRRARARCRAAPSRTLAVERRRETGVETERALTCLEPATLPSIVLISPLWQRRRNGCARSPARLGVGREALVEDGQRDRERRSRDQGRSARAAPPHTTPCR